jgi:hypothetical protein
MEFMFSTAYKVTQRDFYADPYTLVWTPVVAPPHLHRDVTTFLDETFPGRWIGRGGLTARPPLDLRI